MKDRLPIEPLDEAAWSRIEARAIAAPSAAPARESRRGLALGAIALAVAVVALVVGLWPRDAVVAPEDAVVVTESAPSELRLGSVRLEVAAASELRARGSDAAGWHVELSRGAATFTVPPRAGRPPFAVQCDGARVEVVGTRFTVRRDPALEVRVSRGLVRVTDGETSVEIGAGERWAREAVEAPAPEPLPEISPAPVAPEPRAAEAPRPAGADAAALFARASALEASDPDRASALYAEVERSGGPWAQTALFARGRLAAEHGRQASARRLLSLYLRRHPRGLNAADARRLLTELDP